MLLIEDNPDVMEYLTSCLEESYQLDFAFNGKAGIEKALEIVPDIIISDVMMPEKNGFEVTHFLKNDERTSHIPIILLTAKADINSKVIGLERGADAYLTKPFDKKELQVRLEKLIELRHKLQSHYGGDQAFVGDNGSISNSDVAIKTAVEFEDVFLKKLNDILEKHLNNSDFDIPQLCRELHMSQSQLYRKIKALTDKSIISYLRSFRLHKGKILLQTSSFSISKIAYEVGFTDPAYFSRKFSEEFGIPPSSIRK